MSTEKIKKSALWLTDQSHEILRELSYESGVSMIRIVENALWDNEMFANYAKERGIERVKRRRQGRPSSKDTE